MTRMPSGGVSDFSIVWLGWTIPPDPTGDESPVEARESASEQLRQPSQIADHGRAVSLVQLGCARQVSPLTFSDNHIAVGHCDRECRHVVEVVALPLLLRVGVSQPAHLTLNPPAGDVMDQRT